MKKRINLQYMLLILATILTTIGISTVVYYGVIKKEVYSDLKTYTELMIQSDSWGIISEPENAAQNYINNTQEYKINNIDDELRITLINSEGTAVFDTGADVNKMENHRERPEVTMAFENNEGKTIRKSDTIQTSLFYYARKLDNGYVIRVSKEINNIVNLFIGFIPILILICVVIFAVCMILSHFLTKSIVAPIERLAHNIENTDSMKVYKELEPFVTTIRKQHQDILKNSTMRQEFTANVSHELKTPLTSILGYSELIKNRMVNEEDTIRFAGEIQKSSKRLLTLINDIIRLSELDVMETEVEFENVDIYNIALECCDMLSINCEKENITMKVNGEHNFVSANKRMMEELVYNLCDNAVRYNHFGGSVIVTVGKLNENEGNSVFLEVKDSGIGISKKNQKRIFERFYRVDKSRSKATGGTGLGLAIVKHIMAKHENAHIELESEPGKGTTIRVIFEE